MWATSGHDPCGPGPPKRGGKPRWLHKSYYVGGLNGGKWGTYPLPSQKRYISLVMSNFAFFWGGLHSRCHSKKYISVIYFFFDARMNDTSLLLHSAAALRYCSSVPLHATAGAEWCYPRLLHSAAAFSCLCTVPPQTSACAMPVLLPSTTDAQCSCGGFWTCAGYCRHPRPLITAHTVVPALVQGTQWHKGTMDQELA